MEQVLVPGRDRRGGRVHRGGGPARPGQRFAAAISPPRPLVAGLLRKHAGLAAGAGVVLAPRHGGRCAPLHRVVVGRPSAQIVPLEVDLDPESAEFYDYTTTDWYREPERTGAPTLAGPYVDFICTHEYTFTLAAPVRRAGRFIGVAAADILATQVERLVLPGCPGWDWPSWAAARCWPALTAGSSPRPARACRPVWRSPPPRPRGSSRWPGQARSRRWAGGSRRGRRRARAGRGYRAGSGPGRRQTCCRGHCSPFPLRVNPAAA